MNYTRRPAAATKVKADPDNLGDKAQDEFETFWVALKKHGYLYRFRDQKDLWRLNNGATRQYELPSDYLGSAYGFMALYEVKGTGNAVGFAISGIKRSQKQAAAEVHLSGGLYFFAIRAYALCVNSWFLVPGQDLINRRGRIPWSELAAYKTKEPIFVP